jgi:hypothetical protein
MDAFVVNLGSPATLIHNVSTDTGHWIAFQLRGHKSNRDGIGTRIEVFTGTRKQIAERIAGSGYLSQDDARVHFGLGPASKIDKVVLHWPSGKEQVLENVAVDRVLTVEEPK